MKKETTIRIAFTGVLMAMNIALSSFGVPVPGGHLYLCDIVICLAALLLNPLEAFVACGVGAFLGDLIFYPAPMFVSLVTHGIQGVVISLIAQKTLKKHPLSAQIIAVTIGAIIMVVGYTLGKIYVYSTKEYAIIKLPYEIAQAAIGAIVGLLLYHKAGIGKLFRKYVK